MAIDIAERKQMEQALRTSNEDLIHFSYAASHDLQEPLRAVITYAQLLEKRVDGQLGEDAVDCLRFIRDSAGRLEGLLRDLRVYMEVDHNLADTPDLVDCNSILSDVCADRQAAINETAAVITHDPLPIVPGRKLLFVELFQNLLSNAIKYRASEAPVVHVSAEWRSGECVISVRDNGIGIAREDAKDIFDPFKRLRRDVPGTGWGWRSASALLNVLEGASGSNRSRAEARHFISASGPPTISSGLPSLSHWAVLSWNGHRRNREIITQPDNPCNPFSTTSWPSVRGLHCRRNDQHRPAGPPWRPLDEFRMDSNHSIFRPRAG
jgi:light-regulated signal transduction histidine kinase (bacteriophytochrome)